MKPRPDQYPAYYQRYINKIEESDLMRAFEHQQQSLEKILDAIGEEQGDYAYAPEKWTIKQLIQHCADAERVFCFRALWFARNSGSALPGFDENEWAKQTAHHPLTLQAIKKDFLAVRNASQSLFASFSSEMLDHFGIANGVKVSVHAIGFFLLGHWKHHSDVLIECYAVKA